MVHVNNSKKQVCLAENDCDVRRRMDNVVVRLLIELKHHSYLLLSDIITFLNLSHSPSFVL